MSTQASVATPYYNPLSVSCPTCNQPAGEYCKGMLSIGIGVNTHIDRYRKAQSFHNHPSNQPAPRRYDTQLLCKCWFCQQTGMQYELDEPNTPNAPRTPSCTPGCTLNSNHQGDCND